MFSVIPDMPVECCKLSTLLFGIKGKKMKDLCCHLGFHRSVRVKQVTYKCSSSWEILEIFCSIFPWLGAFVIYASLVLMVARLKSDI